MIRFVRTKGTQGTPFRNGKRCPKCERPHLVRFRPLTPDALRPGGVTCTTLRCGYRLTLLLFP